MSLLSRSAGMIALSLGLGAAAVAAQEPDRGGAFRWYVGAEAGMLNFKTPTQTRGGVFTAGGHLLVMARRTGLMLAVDEAFSKDQSSSFVDATAPGGTRFVAFDHIRKYSATIAAFPVKPTAVLQPYLGIGFGILHVVNPTATPASVDPNVAQDEASDRGTTGFGAFTGGLQFRLSRVVLFGQYQITTSPNRTKLLEGPTHQIVGGLRVSLGNANEGLTGGGY